MNGSNRMLAAAAVFAVALAYFCSFADYGFHREDEGALLVQFWRWSRGEVPYTDFHLGYTPGVHFVHKTLMQWFGPGVMPGRYLLAAVNAAACACLFLASSRLSGSWKWGMLTPLLYLAAIPVFSGEFAAFNIPYPVWYSVLLFSVTAVTMPALRARPSLTASAIGGALAGLNFTFKPNVGLFHLAAIALVCLAAHGRPTGARDRVLWWTWWLSVHLGLLFVFASAPTRAEAVFFLAPVAAIAFAIARDAYRAPPRSDVPSLFLCALAIGGAFVVAGTPWMIWAFSILGPEWFARRALFLGTGFEQFYYLGAPPFGLGLLAVVASVAIWFTPAWLRARGWQPWPLIPAGVAGAAMLLGIVLLTRPMSSGFYGSLMTNLEPKAFAAATFVQWLAILAWLGRRHPQGIPPASDVLGPGIICGALLYLQIFPRTDFMHWVTAAPLLLPLVVWGLQAISVRWSIGAGRASRRMVAAAVVLPVVALAMLRIGHSLDARWDLHGVVPVRTPETRLAIEHAPLSINVGQAERYRDLEAVVQLVHDGSRADDAVFTFPALDFVSFFSLRSPQNRHGYYFPGWPGHEVEAEVLTFLEQRPPALVVSFHEHQLFFADAPAYYFQFHDFVERHYSASAVAGPYAVLARNDRESTPAVRPRAAPFAVAEAAGSRRLGHVRQLIESASSDDRIEATRVMGEWHITGDFEPLRAALTDEDPGVRSAAVKAASATQSPAVRDVLLAAVASGSLHSSDAVLALRAAAVSCDRTCVPVGISLLASPDSAVAGAARHVLSTAAERRWRSSFWWKAGLDVDGEPLEGETAGVLRAAVADPESDPLLREIGLAYAGEIGLNPCSPVVRRAASKRPQAGGGDRTALLALLSLARHDCRGNRLAAALRWLASDNVLAPRVVLLEARRNMTAADQQLSSHVDRSSGVAAADALWISSMAGASASLATARRVLEQSTHEGERVAAAWAWSQLAPTQEQLEDLWVTMRRDASPQVRETAAYGLRRRQALRPAE